MTPFIQLIGIIRYEFRLQWRRRGMLVITLGMMVIPIASAIGVRSLLTPMQASWVTSGGLDPAQLRHLVTLSLLPITWVPVYTVLTIILPIIAADAVPRDRQNGIREVLCGLPLTNGIYLMGKLCAVWFSILSSTAIALALTGMAWWLIIGPFEISLYLQMWLLGIVPLGVLNAGLSTLMASGQPSARRAVFVGVFISVLSVFSLTQSLEYLGERSLGDLFNIARPALFLYYFQNMQMPGTNTISMPVSIPQMLATIAIGLLQLLLVGLVMRAWLNKKGI